MVKNNTTSQSTGLAISAAEIFGNISFLHHQLSLVMRATPASDRNVMVLIIKGILRRSDERRPGSDGHIKEINPIGHMIL